MSFELYERDTPIVREDKSGTTVTVRYGFTGTGDRAALRMYVLDQTPVTITHGGKALGRSGWEPDIKPGDWGYVDVIYDSGTTGDTAIPPEGPPGSGGGTGGGTPTFPTPSDTDTLDSAWSLTTRGGTVHINVAKRTRYTVGIGGAPPVTDNVIGPGPNSVRGCDIHGMKLSASITMPTALNLPLIRALTRIDEPKQNNAEWLGMDAGEWLYVGCDAQGSGTTGIGTLTIHLEGGQNIMNGDDAAEINDDLTLVSPDAALPAKYAHEFVDFVYEKDETTGLQKAIGAYVYEVYGWMDFAATFGFG